MLPAHSRGFGLSCSDSISSPRGAPAIPAGGHKRRWRRRAGAPGRRRAGAPTSRRADAPGRRRAGPSSAEQASGSTLRQRWARSARLPPAHAHEATASASSSSSPPERSLLRAGQASTSARMAAAAATAARMAAAARRSRLLCDLCCGVVVHTCRHRRSLQGVLYPLFVRNSERTPSINRNL